MGLGIRAGNILGQWIVSLTISPASVAANTGAEQTFALPGVKVGDFVHVNKPTTQAGLGVGNVRVSAVDQIAIEFLNATAGAIVPTAAQAYTVLVTRPENATLPTYLGD